jgi:hypothetical protein
MGVKKTIGTVTGQAHITAGRRDKLNQLMAELERLTLSKRNNFSVSNYQLISGPNNRWTLICDVKYVAAGAWKSDINKFLNQAKAAVGTTAEHEVKHYRRTESPRDFPFLRLTE